MLARALPLGPGDYLVRAHLNASWRMADMVQPPPPFSATAIEMICRVLADAVTGAQIPNLIAPLKVDEKPGEERNTKWKRLHNAVAARQNIQQDGRPLVRLVLQVMNPVRFSTPTEFNSIRIALNERLLFSGLELREDGRVYRVAMAETLSDAQRRADDLGDELKRRDVHPEVLRFCKAELLVSNYFHAVLESWKSVADKLRQMTGLTGDGAQLVDAACSLSNGGPIVSLGDMTTEWGRSEHKGVAMMMKGIFSTFRNPVAHAPKIAWSTSRSDALDMLTLASMLHRRLDSATVVRRS